MPRRVAFRVGAEEREQRVGVARGRRLGGHEAADLRLEPPGEVAERRRVVGLLLRLVLGAADVRAEPRERVAQGAGLVLGRPGERGDDLEAEAAAGREARRFSREFGEEPEQRRPRARGALDLRELVEVADADARGLAARARVDGVADDQSEAERRPERRRAPGGVDGGLEAVDDRRGRREARGRGQPRQGDVDALAEAGRRRHQLRDPPVRVAERRGPPERGDLRGNRIFNASVIAPDSSAVLRDLDESNRFVQKSAESTSI